MTEGISQVSRQKSIAPLAANIKKNKTNKRKVRKMRALENSSIKATRIYLTLEFLPFYSRLPPSWCCRDTLRSHSPVRALAP
jgi:hypothetical protein